MLFVRFTSPNLVEICLKAELFTVTETGRFITALESILEAIPNHYSLMFGHTVQIGTQFVLMEEQYAIDEDTIRITLGCSYDNKIYSSTGLIEFDAVLESLKRSLHQSIKVCAFCKHGNLTSLSDLRYGWYCFRDIENPKYELPWSQRHDEFQKAISNVGALHSCNQFTSRE